MSSSGSGDEGRVSSDHKAGAKGRSPAGLDILRTVIYISSRWLESDINTMSQDPRFFSWTQGFVSILG